MAQMLLRCAASIRARKEMSAQGILRITLRWNPCDSWDCLVARSETTVWPSGWAGRSEANRAIFANASNASSQCRSHHFPQGCGNVSLLNCSNYFWNWSQRTVPSSPFLLGAFRLFSFHRQPRLGWFRWFDGRESGRGLFPNNMWQC